MSRIGKLPVPIPAKVKVEVQGREIRAEGPKGRLCLTLPGRTEAVVEAGRVLLRRPDDLAQSRAHHGLARALVNNLVQGVATGFSKKLEIQGVGFKAAVQGKVLNLSLGYSHPIDFAIPDQIKITVEENTKITIEGPDRQRVGQVAAEIRSFYPPEPYKGKGVRYSDERVKRKEGKTVQ